MTPISSRTISAIVKQEGASHNVRLCDQHGLELPAFVYETRNGIDPAWIVASFINGLAPVVREALYQAIIKE